MREHAELVEETLEARIEAGLVEDVEQERERLAAKTEGLHELIQDALKVAAKQKLREATPKAKYTGPSSELKTIIENTRQRLFGRRSE